MKLLAYFDESEDQETFCLAGWFSVERHWAPFEERWAAILNEEGIAPEFKMSDCENRRGAFETWTVRDERRRVQQQLLDLITVNQSPVPCGIIVGFDGSVYGKRSAR